jgi:UDP-N-acetylmuramyl pentapeptide synthase
MEISLGGAFTGVAVLGNVKITGEHSEREAIEAATEALQQNVFVLVSTGESSTYGHPFGSTAVQVAIDALPEGKWRHFAVRVG